MPKQALWSAIQSEIEADIHIGSYPASSKLPTEAELAARFGVNRHTVRRALAALAEAQIVHPRRGAGVFVQPDVTRYPIGNRVRFHKNLKADGKLPTKSVLTLETRPANAAEAEQLMLGAYQIVHVYNGFSSANGVPIACFASTFPAAVVPDVPQYLREAGSVTEALRRSGIVDYTRRTTEVSARSADATQANLLHVAASSALIYVESMNAISDGTPIEFGCTFFVGDRVTLTFATTA